MLVVPEICAGGYGDGRVREGSKKWAEGLGGGSTPGAAVGMVEEGSVRGAWCPVTTNHGSGSGLNTFGLKAAPYLSS